jgi:Holliday junction resolvasome RuvABC ATP-dependent DNA helicase subunit
MEVKKISIETDTTSLLSQRPEAFTDFVGQDPIKAVLATAIDSAQKRQ